MAPCAPPFNVIYLFILDGFQTDLFPCCKQGIYTIKFEHQGLDLLTACASQSPVLVLKKYCQDLLKTKLALKRHEVSYFLCSFKEKILSNVF